MVHVPGLQVNFAYSDRCQTFARCCHMVPTAFPSTRAPADVSIRAPWCRMLVSFQLYQNVPTCAVHQNNSRSTCRRRIEVKLCSHLLGGTRR
jgi:hypothetical protein